MWVPHQIFLNILKVFSCRKKIQKIKMKKLSSKCNKSGLYQIDSQEMQQMLLINYSKWKTSNAENRWKIVFKYLVDTKTLNLSYIEHALHHFYGAKANIYSLLSISKETEGDLTAYSRQQKYSSTWDKSCKKNHI